MELTKDQQEVLSIIQQKSNRLFGAKLFKTVKPNKDLMKGFDALEKSDLPDWKKRFYRAIRDDYDTTETVLNEKVAKQKDEFVEKEIKKAIKKGLLPKYVSTIQTNKVGSDVQKGDSGLSTGSGLPQGVPNR